MTGSDPSIDISVESGAWPERAELQAVAERAIGAALAELRSAKDLGKPDRAASVDQEIAAGAELSILFTNDAAIRRLNATWRGKDAATNVLSFPQAAGPLMGDIILAHETVSREAALAGRALEAHMAHLITHGFLHLLGYDHESDAQAEPMEAIESAALARIGIADPYAAAHEP